MTASPNPAFTTAPGNSVIATATVTSGGNPVTAGTVSFTANGSTLSGCGAVGLNASGEATCSTTFAAEGPLSSKRFTAAPVASP